VDVPLRDPANDGSVLDGVKQHDEANAAPQDGGQIIGQGLLEQPLFQIVLPGLGVNGDDGPHPVIEDAVEAVIQREMVFAQVHAVDVVRAGNDLLLFEDQSGDRLDEIDGHSSVVRSGVLKTLARHENRADAHGFDRLVLRAVGMGGYLRIDEIGRPAPHQWE